MDAYTRLDAPPDNASIWRYVNLEKLLSLLQSRQLFFIALDRLDDPYEGYYPEDVWRQYIGPLIMEQASERLSYKLALASGLSNEDQLRDKEKKDYTHMIRKQCYVNCWHVNEHDSAATWSLYAGRAGVAIKSTFERLGMCLTTVAGPISAGLVRYVDHSTITAAGVGGYPAWYLKRKSFEHERELRAVLIRNLSEVPCGIPIPIDLDLLIEEIVVEPRADDWVTSVVSDVVRRYGFTFTVRRSDLYNLA